MSLGRAFLINELRRLETRFHPDGPDDEIAVEYIRAAIQALSPKVATPKRLKIRFSRHCVRKLPEIQRVEPAPCDIKTWQAMI